LIAILNNVDQTVFGNPAYSNGQDKAAHLLYFIIKNHLVSDGNKSTATLPLSNNALLNKDGQPVITGMRLTALTLQCHYIKMNVLRTTP
jgi:hypothetical protein